MDKSFMQARSRLWLLSVGVATLIIGASYTIAQQSTRLAAGDLPLSSAQTAYQEVASGAAPADVVPKTRTDLRSDFTSFVIITDQSQHVLASSARLNGQTPLPPAGAFTYTKSKGSDHFTWQPAGGVRLATQMLSYGSGVNAGFIITGQSLSQAENRIGTYGALALAAWIGTIAWTTLVLYWSAPKPTKTKK